MSLGDTEFRAIVAVCRSLAEQSFCNVIPDWNEQVKQLSRTRNDPM